MCGKGNAIGEGIAQAFSLDPVQNTLYRVIAGSFQNRNNALNREQFLESNGIDSFVMKTSVSGETWYRVQAGAFRDRSNAEARLSEVKELGITDAYILQD